MHPVSRAVLDRTPASLRRPVSVAVRTIDNAGADRLPGLAAEIAFWISLSLPATAVTAIAAMGLIGSLDNSGWQDQLINRAIEVSRVALTPTTIEQLVEPVLRNLIDQSGVGLVSFAFLTAVWTASRAVRVVITTVTIVYERRGVRPPWMDRLVGFGLTVGALVGGTVLAPLLLAGPAFGEQLETWAGIDLSPLPQTWRLLYWPTVVIFGMVAVSLLFHLAIPGRTPWRYDIPGAVFATAAWLAGSGALRLYGAYISRSGSVYGPLAGPVVLLLWLWLTGFALLLGAELNATISAESRAVPDVEHRDPDAVHRDPETEQRDPDALADDHDRAAGGSDQPDAELNPTEQLPPAGRS